MKVESIEYTDGRIVFGFEWQLTNTLNQREHWSKKAKRMKDERLLGKLAIPGGIHIPSTITLTRIAPRSFDSDGLAASFKALRDGIADRLGINDGSDKVKWLYAQRKGEPKKHFVLIEFT